METKEYHREYNRNRYQRLRAEYITMLGGKCVMCGSTDDLEFDHINPNTKSLELGLLLNYAQSIVKEELMKCQLLCESHHIEKTISEQRTYEHGSWMYTKYGCRCVICCTAKKEYNKWTKRNRPVSTRITSRELVHGTRAGYMKELRQKLTPCIECKQAQNEYMKIYNASKRNAPIP